MDLMDITGHLNQSFKSLTTSIGRYLGEALKPLLIKTFQVFNSFSEFLDKIKKSDKNLLFLTKTVLVATTAVAGLVAILGSLSLLVKLLGVAGFGLPGMVYGILTLGSAFLGITGKADSFLDRLKIMGAFFKGIWQLYSSFDPETGFGKIDESLKKFLEEKGLMTFVETIAKVFLMVKTVIKDTIDVLSWAAKGVDNFFGGMAQKVIEVLDILKGPWSNFWVKDNATMMEKAARWITVVAGIAGSIAALIGGFKVFSKVASMIPGMGRFFGGRGPKGTKNDPLYVVGSGFGGPILDSENWVGMGKGKKGGGGIAGKIGGFFRGWKGPAALMAAMELPELISNLSSANSTQEMVGAGAQSTGRIGGALLGTKAGAALGGMLGSIIPGLGTMIGAGVGGFVGGAAGYAFGGNAMESLANWLYEKVTGKDADSKKSEATVPAMPETEESKIDYIAKEMQARTLEEQEKIKSATESALRSSSEGGKTISEDEWRHIMILVGKIASTNEEMAKKEEVTTISSKYGDRSPAFSG